MFRILSQQNPTKRFLYSVRNYCWDLSAFEVKQVEEFQCYQMEADTILLFIYSQMRKAGMRDHVVLDAEDTDVVVLAGYVAHQVDGVLGIKRKGSIFDCRSLCSPEMAQVIVPLHIHTGADAVSGFFGHGKRTVFNSVQRSQEAKDLLTRIGKSLPITEEVEQNMTQFTIRHVYQDRISHTLGEARTSKWMKMKKKSTLRIPPDQDSHLLKVKRVNYQVFLFYNYHSATVPPSPLGHGWTLEGGRCVPIRYTKPALPKELSDLIIGQGQLLSLSDSESESDSDGISDSDEA